MIVTGLFSENARTKSALLQQSVVTGNYTTQETALLFQDPQLLTAFAAVQAPSSMPKTWLVRRQLATNGILNRIMRLMVPEKVEQTDQLIPSPGVRNGSR